MASSADDTWHVLGNDRRLDGDWAVLSQRLWSPALEDASSVASVESMATVSSRLSVPQPLSAVSYLEALLSGGGGLTGERAAAMKVAFRRIKVIAVPCRHPGMRSSLEETDEDDEHDADEEWWTRKGLGASVAMMRWRRGSSSGKQSGLAPPGAPGRRGLPIAHGAAALRRSRRLPPVMEYECGTTAVGFMQTMGDSADAMGFSNWYDEDEDNWD